MNSQDNPNLLCSPTADSVSLSMDFWVSVNRGTPYNYNEQTVNPTRIYGIFMYEEQQVTFFTQSKLFFSLLIVH